MKSSPPSGPPLLDIRGLKTWYPVKKGVFARTVGHVRAVDGVDLTLARGETLGIVGESGCGKSTLARTILRLERPREGTIHVNGIDVLRVRGAALRAYRRTVQVVFQDPHASLNPRHTVLDILTEAMLAHGLVTRENREAAAVRLLADVGLPGDILDRYPHAFSGGQRQRLCIARALALEPQLLICDEAVSALDLSVRAQVLNLLEELQDKHGLAYLFITHDIGVVQHIADRIAVMYLGNIVETGPAQAVLGEPAHPYTQLLLRAVPQIGVPLPEETGGPSEPPRRRSQTGCPFVPRCPLADATCRAATPILKPLPNEPDHKVACFKA
ncbi:MAG TPA: ATP-binding cassette domain-containing protein [Kiritimatiellia bacterium]|nr:ATP-binding cassette domain-containing protein [Kiritimatiellia bacterium]HRU71778.1 ATP-binding cassette domain-containing protein [Kiritimatiellia bacterium]